MAEEQPNDATAEPRAGEPTEATPPWGTAEEFNAERAWELIQNLRSDKDSLKAKSDEYAGKVKAFEDAKLTAEEKASRDLKEALTNSESLASENALLKAAIDHGLSADDLDLLRGLPADAISERAAKLAARIGTGTQGSGSLTQQPKEALRGGAQPNSPAEPGDWLRQMLAKNNDL